MTIQVKLFSGQVSANYPEMDEKYILSMEKEMNEFLETIKDENVKKIYVAVGMTRMGLIEYKEDNNEINLGEISVENPPPGFNSDQWKTVENMISNKTFDKEDD